MLLLKLTPGADLEGRALCRKAGRRAVVGDRTSGRQASRRDLLILRDARRPDLVVRGRQRHDLSQASDRSAFVAGLGLPSTARRVVLGVLARAPADSRDELAKLARVLGWSERGQIDLRRLVLSGHYAGDGIRGNQIIHGDPRPHNGTLTIATLGAMLAAFPRAAAKIEHLMLASCFLGGRRSSRIDADKGVVAGYRRILPRLRSVTAYAGKAPASDSGAGGDLRRWARATASGETPSRDAVFGRCRAHAAVPSLAHKRAGGVVFTGAGAQRCSH